ncbi:response regulator [Natronococcus sp. JC468]|uniref:response regulator n=1 Tax=Natronococcus sp. JC468 TaxID=1961921 RepID=UPI00143A436C|nr:response regulator [Natronococcus sp. JC468]NKE34539.1 response regulator [Natronococcus sp. JC468]
MATHIHQHVDEPIDVLLVDDNPGDVRLTREAFETARTTVETELHAVSTGDEALAALSQSDEYSAVPPPDLVLLDLNLPGHGGCDVLERIRNDRRLRRLPVLILTSSADEDDVSRCYTATANAYLTKPVDPGEFVSIVEAIDRFWFEQARLPPTDR